jgi:hypothetical protein
VFDRGSDDLEFRPAGWMGERSGFEFSVRGDHDSRRHRSGTRTNGRADHDHGRIGLTASILDRDGESECTIADHRQIARRQ